MTLREELEALAHKYRGLRVIRAMVTPSVVEEELRAILATPDEPRGDMVLDVNRCCRCQKEPALLCNACAHAMYYPRAGMSYSTLWLWQ
jgi:hypothetical protein